MLVFRVEKNTNYTTMCNYHLRDKNLTLKAKGLLSVFLSLPDNWDYSIAVHAAGTAGTYSHDNYRCEEGESL